MIWAHLYVLWLLIYLGLFMSSYFVLSVYHVFSESHFPSPPFMHYFGLMQFLLFLPHPHLLIWQYYFVSILLVLSLQFKRHNLIFLSLKLINIPALLLNNMSILFSLPLTTMLIYCMLLCIFLASPSSTPINLLFCYYF